MNERELAVVMNGRRLGQLRQLQRGAIELVYDDAYRDDPDSTPLSTSMPLAIQRFTDRAVRPFLVGLLPDNDAVLARWANTFGVSQRNPFALLSCVGEDCAGAAQFVRPERLDTLGEGGIDWLSDAEVEERLRALRLDPTAWLWGDDDQGQFSLAGAQSKIALYREDGRWGRPYGCLPTTHIFKVASGQFASQELIEHVTMRAASLVGLTVARSELAAFGEEQAIVLERYDRLRVDGSLLRIHQEDLCQALGIPPDKKYQRQGGPGPVDIFELIRSRMERRPAADAVDRFVDALVFNWFVGGTDAHAKNYSLLMSGPDVRLAPLYDLTSGLPYREELLGPRGDSRIRMGGSKLRMAMTIGGEAAFDDVRLSNWQTLARQAGIEFDALVDRMRDIAHRLPDAVSTAAAGVPSTDAQPMLERLVDRVAKHVGLLTTVTGLLTGGSTTPDQDVLSGPSTLGIRRPAKDWEPRRDGEHATSGRRPSRPETEAHGRASPDG